MRTYLLSFADKVVSVVISGLFILYIGILLGPDNYGKFAVFSSIYLFSVGYLEGGILAVLYRLKLEILIANSLQYVKVLKEKSYRSILILLFGSIVLFYLDSSVDVFLSLIYGIFALIVYSNSIVYIAIQTKSDNYKVLILSNIVAYVVGMAVVLAMSKIYKSFALGILYLFVINFVRFLCLKFSTRNHHFLLSEQNNKINGVNYYEKSLTKIAILNQLFVLFLDLILSTFLNATEFGRYKFSLFLVNTILITVMASVERVFFTKYLTEIPRSNQFRFLILVYILYGGLFCLPSVMLIVDRLFGMPTGVNAMIKVDIYYLTLLSLLLLPVEYVLMMLFKMSEKYVDKYRHYNELSKLFFLIFLLLFFIILKISVGVVCFMLAVFSLINVISLLSIWKKSHS